LFHGSGPIDGPIEIGSSTRSELGGFTGPLLLVTILARYWGLRHRCKFRWLVDSRVAINRVTFVTRKDFRPHTQPDNNDYLSVIADLHKELRRPITQVWIKSHQDDTTKHTSLSEDAKLNVDADKLATEFHKKPRAHPICSTAHLPTTKISISINKTRYFGNVDANLRFHINGGYLKNYLQTKHGWTNAVWNSIVMQAFGRHLKKLSLSQKTTHLKFIHNLQPLGINIFRRSKTKDPILKLCPCCTHAEEDQQHYLSCTRNTKREMAFSTLLNTIMSNDVHPFGIALATCIENAASDPSNPITLKIKNYHERYHTHLTAALDAQQKIGWTHMLHGFLATAWQELAAINMLKPTKPENPRGHHRIQLALKALHLFTWTLWLGRNYALHHAKDKAAAIIYSAESAELRHYHSDPKLLKQQDQHYCARSLDRLLTSQPSVRRRWLQRVRTARALFIKDGQSQQVITRYITHHKVPPNDSNTEQDISNIRNARTRTTQQRLTEFFPGRPPDSTSEEPGNPSLA
jgi:hypothetical protein